MLSDIHLEPIRFRHFFLLTQLNLAVPQADGGDCPVVFGVPTNRSGFSSDRGKTMTFVVAQRIRSLGRLRGRSMLRAGRLLTNRLCTLHIPTPEERANLYVSLTPVAVLSSAPGGQSPGGGGNDR
ncbi:hypothetical protein [Mycobacterium lentiflavum]|uniref:Uncharacterized protein n=2 Tax=Mycobacterium lentiflavum TaxID=141349 RepID=A0ABY3UZ90_MYCLN|nr:hypothetical protein [Mycobacterium lentiflavum]ULP42703.1 hypothetical protein MJO58_01405 [Mycobacterium lentiflavum]